MNQQRNNEVTPRSQDWKFIGALLAVLAIMIASLFVLLNLQEAVNHVEEQLEYRTPTRAASGASSSTLQRVKSQSVYVPVYSHVYVKDGSPFRLTATLSIRNTDPAQPLVVDGVAYFDSDGHLVREYVDEPITVAPHATIEYLIKEQDVSGGSGANFVVDWATENTLALPVIEAVMIGTASNQGISFISPGVVVSEVMAKDGQ